MIKVKINWLLKWKKWNFVNYANLFIYNVFESVLKWCAFKWFGVNGFGWDEKWQIKRLERLEPHSNLEIWLLYEEKF